MTWNVKYWDECEGDWRIGLTALQQEPAEQLAGWLNEIGWRARVEKDLNDASDVASQPSPHIRRRQQVSDMSSVPHNVLGHRHDANPASSVWSHVAP
jgi:hypothetical protein